MADTSQERTAQALAPLRVAGYLSCACLLFILDTVPFLLGLAVQALVPRRLSRVAQLSFASSAFVLAWLAFDHVPLLSITRESRFYWPGILLDWLLSILSFVFASFLLRAFWPRRFQPAAQAWNEATGRVPAGAAQAQPRLLEDVKLTFAAARFWLRELRFSVIAAIAVFVLGFVSMGLLGIALHFLAAPVVNHIFLHPKPLLGDWVWPALIGTGMAWAAAFILAGIVDRPLKRRRTGMPLRVVVYVAVLWFGDVMIWTVTLAFAPVSLP